MAVLWKNPAHALACASRVHRSLQHRLPQIQTLHPPQHPDDLARQLRSAYMGPTEPTDNADNAHRRQAAPPKTLLVSALRVKNAQCAHKPDRPVTASSKHNNGNVRGVCGDGVGVVGDVKREEEEEEEGDLFADFGPPMASARAPVAPPVRPLTHKPSVPIASSMACRPVVQSSPQNLHTHVRGSGANCAGVSAGTGKHSSSSDSDDLSVSSEEPSQSSLLCSAPDPALPHPPHPAGGTGTVRGTAPTRLSVAAKSLVSASVPAPVRTPTPLPVTAREPMKSKRRIDSTVAASTAKHLPAGGGRVAKRKK